MVANLARGAYSALEAGWQKGVQWGAPIAKLGRFPVDPGIAEILSGDGAIRLPEPLAGRSLGRIGSLEVRLARKNSEIRRAQRLRYKVFYEEMSAVPTALAALSRRDADAYDAICDHLVVLDHAEAKPAKTFGAPRPKVVGTYRLLRGDVAARHDGFYAQGEFDLGPVIAAQGGRRLLELGRSCVLKPYRGKRTVELLWQGIYAYVVHHRIDALIGCASLGGHRSRPARPAAQLPPPPRPGPRGLARSRPARPRGVDGPDAPRGDHRKGRASGAAAADQGLPAGRGDVRRRRRDRSAIRHHRRVRGPAGGGHRRPLPRAFRAGRVIFVSDTRFPPYRSPSASCP